MSSQNTTTRRDQSSRLSRRKRNSDQMDSLGISHSYIKNDDYTIEYNIEQNQTYQTLLEASKVDAWKTQVKAPRDQDSPPFSPRQTRLQDGIEVEDKRDS